MDNTRPRGWINQTDRVRQDFKQPPMPLVAGPELRGNTLETDDRPNLGNEFLQRLHLGNVIIRAGRQARNLIGHALGHAGNQNDEDVG